MWDFVYGIIEFLWGVPLIATVTFVGLFFSWKTGFFQLRKLPMAFQSTLMVARNKSSEAGEGALSAFEVICMVLSGTIGSGNIAGVATAIAIGGPGAVFWMWIIVVLCMIIKMVEVTLAVHYRVQSEGGCYGGPMYYMKKGIRSFGGVLAGVYVVALMIYVLTDACFVQTNTLASSALEVFNVQPIFSGVCIVGISLFLVWTNGVERIGTLCTYMLPFMLLIYSIGALGVIISNIQNIPQSLATIMKYAFQPAPAVGGFAGASVSSAISKGFARGVFSNEAGMGTSATIHAMARTSHPIYQGMIGVVEVVIDAAVCTLTALSVVGSGAWDNGNSGIPMMLDAFSGTWGAYGSQILGVIVILFTFSSYIGFFAEFKTCLSYCMNQKMQQIFQFVYFIPPLLAVTMPIEQIWDLADMAVGFIMMPNLLALFLLRSVFQTLFLSYQHQVTNNSSNS